MLAVQVWGAHRAPLHRSADAGEEIGCIESILESVEAVVRPQVELLPAVLTVQPGVELGRDHRLAGPPAEELVTPLAVEDGAQARLPGGPGQEKLRPGDRVSERQVEFPHQVHEDWGEVFAAHLHIGERDPERLGYCFRLLLFDCVLAEVEGERLYVHADLPQPDRDAGRVEAARKEQADLALSVEPPGNRLATQPPD